MIGELLMLAVMQAGAPAAYTAVPPRPDRAPRVVYTVKVQGASGPGCQVDRTFHFRRSPGFGGPPKDVVWTVERIEQNRFICRGEKHLWIDGRSCPALGRALSEIAKLPAMRFQGPDDGKPTGMVFDVPTTSLSAQPVPAAGVQPLVTRTEYFGPVASWWARTEKALESCWRREQPDQAATASP